MFRHHGEPGRDRGPAQVERDGDQRARRASRHSPPAPLRSLVFPGKATSSLGACPHGDGRPATPPRCNRHSRGERTRARCGIGARAEHEAARRLEHAGGSIFLVAGYASTRGSLEFATAAPITDAHLHTPNAVASKRNDYVAFLADLHENGSRTVTAWLSGRRAAIGWRSIVDLQTLLQPSVRSASGIVSGERGERPTPAPARDEREVA